MTFFWSGCPEWMLTIVVAAPNGWAAAVETALAAAIKRSSISGSRGGSRESQLSHDRHDATRHSRQRTASRAVPQSSSHPARLELSASQSRGGAGDPLGAVALARLGAGEDRLEDSRVRLLRRAR